jgi:hypothetical protein
VFVTLPRTSGDFLQATRIPCHTCHAVTVHIWIFGLIWQAYVNYITPINYNTLNKSLLTLVIALHVYPKLMSTLLSKPSTHSEEKRLSYSKLLKSCNFTTCTSGYHSESLRQSLTKACSKRCNNIPYERQLDAAEAFFLGLNETLSYVRSLPTTKRMNRLVRLCYRIHELLNFPKVDRRVRFLMQIV